MLAFGPIAAAPLADDVGGIGYQLSADHGSFTVTGQTNNLPIDYQNLLKHQL